MAVLLVIFLVKLLSLVGIGGLIAGLFIKKWPVAAGAGLALGIIDSLVLASMRYTGVDPIDYAMAILVAILMATVGWLLRGRKRS